jgi:energy-coupling factor transporter ATP-binding protein EcfA2
MNQEPKPLKILAFLGPAGSGKSTCCQLLHTLGREEGKKVVRLSFADPLKKVCSDIYCFAYDIPSESFYGTQEEKEAPHEAIGFRSGREILQFIGTGGFRAMTPDVWVQYMLKHCEITARYGADLIVIDDLRYINEAAALRTLGAYIVRVQRETPIPESNGSTAQHISETEQKTIDADEILWNNQDLSKLQRQLKRLLPQ